MYIEVDCVSWVVERIESKSNIYEGMEEYIDVIERSRIRDRFYREPVWLKMKGVSSGWSDSLILKMDRMDDLMILFNGTMEKTGRLYNKENIQQQKKKKLTGSGSNKNEI